MTLEEITDQLRQKEQDRDAQIRILRKARCGLLEQIHSQQQLLDKLDYMLYELKKKE